MNPHYSKVRATPQSEWTRRPATASSAGSTSPTGGNAASDPPAKYSKASQRELRAGRARFRLSLREAPVDVVLFAVLLLLSAVTRFWRLTRPASVVFDEFHFGKFLTYYFTGEYFFDIHPPLGKLLLLLGARLHGYNTSFGYDHIGRPYPDRSYLGPRAVAAVFGTLIVPLTYAVGREWGMSAEASALAASWLLLDMCLTIESRLILVDSQVVFFSALSLYCVLRLWATRNRTRQRWRWLLLTGIACGCAISTKWTALATPALGGLLSLSGSRALLGTRHRLPLWQCALVGVIALSLYSACFWVHFRLLPRHGTGDEFMLPDFKITLAGRPDHDPHAPAVPFWRKFRYLNLEMFRANARISERHPWESKWHSWPLTRRGLLYWIHAQRIPLSPAGTLLLNESVPLQNSTAPAGPYAIHEARVYLLINPVVAWGSLLALAVFMAMWTQRLLRWATQGARAQRQLLDKAGPHGARYWNRFYAVGLFFYAGWALNLLPYLGVRRPAFLYHYLPGLYYAVLLAAWLVDRALPSATVRRVLVAAAVALASWAFLYFAPWVYGLPLTPAQQQARQWFAGWK
ncbi:hypothetical protein CDCA_CDCA14G3825 [Cyanidium caldarium]|uniref:Dolichyl-phosphate-mannose--protein mannosyltransferase n=1 Tax=Cyanidium caldarium TaxID=2771 RepID=A0AAV9IZP2_CYACA|nr:hypothetical protein CDCA_CDCA14G3825 [Cyanidium caldarium]